MNWSSLNITVRVGCNLAYETTVETPVLFVLRPRLEGKVLVMQGKLSFGIGLPSYEFQDSHGNITYRSMLMPGRNEIRHDAIVAVSSLPDSREIYGNIYSHQLENQPATSPLASSGGSVRRWKPFSQCTSTHSWSRRLRSLCGLILCSSVSE